MATIPVDVLSINSIYVITMKTTAIINKREAHINWSMVTCKMAAPVTRTTLRTTGPVPVDSRQQTPSVRHCVTR